MHASEVCTFSVTYHPQHTTHHYPLSQRLALSLAGQCIVHTSLFSNQVRCVEEHRVLVRWSLRDLNERLLLYLECVGARFGPLTCAHVVAAFHYYLFY